MQSANLRKNVRLLRDPGAEGGSQTMARVCKRCSGKDHGQSHTRRKLQMSHAAEKPKREVSTELGELDAKTTHTY
jgi:hypothetical protein